MGRVARRTTRGNGTGKRQRAGRAERGVAAEGALDPGRAAADQQPTGERRRQPEERPVDRRNANIAELIERDVPGDSDRVPLRAVADEQVARRWRGRAEQRAVDLRDCKLTRRGERRVPRERDRVPGKEVSDEDVAAARRRRPEAGAFDPIDRGIRIASGEIAARGARRWSPSAGWVGEIEGAGEGIVDPGHLSCSSGSCDHSRRTHRRWNRWPIGRSSDCRCRRR